MIGASSANSWSQSGVRSPRASFSRYAAWTSTLRLRRCARDFRALRDPGAPDWRRASWAAGAVRRSRRLDASVSRERNRLLSRRRRSVPLSRLRKGKPLPDNRARRGVFLSPIDSAFIFGPLDEIRLADLPVRGHGRSGNSALAAAINCDGAAANRATLSFREMNATLSSPLASTGGNKFQALKLLGISRKRLYARLRRYQLD